MADLFVLLGHPVAHSLSPAMYRAAFRSVGVDALYVALDVRDFAAAWTALGRLEVRGGNVTVPWKEAASRALARVPEGVRRARAANTFWRMPEGGFAGALTDGEGFLRSLREDLGLSPAGLRAAVLGAGGAGRAVAHALAAGGAAALYLWNRTPSLAVRLAAEIRAAGYVGEVLSLAEGAGGGSGSPAPAVSPPVLPRGHAVDLLVNATWLGMRAADPAPADPRDFPGIRFAVDLVYGHRATLFQRACARGGARVADGRGTLLHQGASAFELWLGLPAPLEAMREVLEAELGGPRPI
jgi:shikimate dehydrogenase